MRDACACHEIERVFARWAPAGGQWDRSAVLSAVDMWHPDTEERHPRYASATHAHVVVRRPLRPCWQFD
jgi:hypothetical protein